MANETRKYDLDERLLEYSTSVIRLAEDMAKTKAGNHVGGQLLRSGSSPLFHHGEAQAAESPRDFVHKMKVCLQELRESERALRLVKKVPLADDLAHVESLLRETDELIRIFVASIRTAQNNQVREDAEHGCHA